MFGEIEEVTIFKPRYAYRYKQWLISVWLQNNFLINLLKLFFI